MHGCIASEGQQLPAGRDCAEQQRRAGVLNSRCLRAGRACGPLMPTAKMTASADSVLCSPALETVVTAWTPVPLSFMTSPVAKVPPVMVPPRPRMWSASGSRILSATLPRHLQAVWLGLLAAMQRADPCWQPGSHAWPAAGGGLGKVPAASALGSAPCACSLAGAYHLMSKSAWWPSV